MKLLASFTVLTNACSNIELLEPFVELTTNVETGSIVDRLQNMPENVATALDLVFDYLIGSDTTQMLNDGFINTGDLEPEEAEEKPKNDLAKVFLNSILNPVEKANRYLQYDFYLSQIESKTQDERSADLPTYCDKGWRKINGDQCWRYFDERIPKRDAKILCFEKNAEIVKPANRAENIALSNFLWDAEVESCVWLGVNDARNEGTFLFDSTNQVVEHTEFSKHSRINNEDRNSVYYTPSATYSPKRERWFITDADRKCSTVCVKVINLENYCKIMF